MKTIYYRSLVMFLFVAGGIKCEAQDDSRTLLKQVVQQNQEAVDAIAMYPTETRKLIFEATEYPEIIAKLNAMQKKSQDAFENLISSLNKEEQEKIWNLTRYEGLISDLAANQNINEIDNIIANYPEEIHKTALEERKNNVLLLIQIDKMNKGYNADFEQLLAGYPPEAINAFREMIKMPEILSLLFDHMQYTVVVGDYYKKNPERILHKTDSLNLVLTQKNSKEADDWKQSMNDNPQIQAEYTQAAQEYAQDNGYQPEDYNASLTEDVTNYTTNPYNWWFGYPSWYPYNYWNPYPYWYDWGFYYGPGRHAVFFGLPSAYFMDWYFNYPEHFSRYAELSNHYYNYYDRHRESMNYNSISHSVNDWRNRNKYIVNADWDKDNTGRIQRFKDYGQMEVDRNKYNTKHPQKRMEQTEYLQKKQSKYPSLSVNVANSQSIHRDSRSNPVQENNTLIRRPSVAIPGNFRAPANEQSSTQPQQNLQRQNTNISRQQQPAYTSPQTNSNNAREKVVNSNVQQKPVSSPKQVQNFNQIRNAQQYHQNTWKQIQPQQQYTAPRPVQQETRRAEQPARQSTPAPSSNRRR
jgi:hypothetical protein